MILGTICCSEGNKSNPDKNIQLVNNRPLIAYTIQTARRCTILDDFIVYTPNEDVAAAAIEYGAKVPFMRPLASAETTQWATFLALIEAYERQFGKEVSYIVNMDATVPLRSAADIEGAVKMALLYPETDVVITGYRSESNPYFNMVELNKRGYADIVKRMEEPVVRQQDAPAVFSLSGAAFVAKKPALYNYSHWSQAVCKVYEIPRASALDIEKALDFELIKLRLHHH